MYSTSQVSIFLVIFTSVEYFFVRALSFILRIHFPPIFFHEIQKIDTAARGKNDGGDDDDQNDSGYTIITQKLQNLCMTIQA